MTYTDLGVNYNGYQNTPIQKTYNLNQIKTEAFSFIPYSPFASLSSANAVEGELRYISMYMSGILANGGAQDYPIGQWVFADLQVRAKILWWGKISVNNDVPPTGKFALPPFANSGMLHLDKHTNMDCEDLL